MATSHHMYRSQPERKPYFLDTSVASHVLDGDLFHRVPENITRYMSDVRFCCKSLEEVGEHKRVRRTVAAYNWAKKFVEGGGRLLLTPTVTFIFIQVHKSVSFCQWRPGHLDQPFATPPTLLDHTHCILVQFRACSNN